MKRSLALLLALLGLSCALSAAERPKLGDPDFFPITAWGFWEWLSEDPDQEIFDDMAEAGITIAGFTSSTKCLDKLQKAGLYTFACHKIPSEAFWNEEGKSPDEAAIRKGIRDTIEFYGKHPAIAGYLLQDEPTAKRFPVLAIAAEEIQKAQPGMRPYINLNPNYAPADYLGAPTWKEYAERYMDEVKPPILGYDFYALFEDPNEPLRPGYWAQLAECREVALAKGVPMETCLLSVGHLLYRIPSENDLFFEVYSALLYGAKGILYFTYFDPGLANYRHSPVDAYGNRTETWYAMRTVNNSVHTLAPILNRLESTAVYHFQPTPPREREDAPGPDSLIMGVSQPNQSLAIGEFRDRENGDVYVMVLNKDLKLSTHINDLQWRNGAPEDIQICSQKRKGELCWFGGENYWIAPGHATLLKIGK